MRPKAPFDNSLLRHAMIGLVGREPDRHWGGQANGHIVYKYLPNEATPIEKLEDHAQVIAGWLDLFDIRFSGSRCSAGFHKDYSDETPFLLVEVKFDVDEGRSR